MPASMSVYNWCMANPRPFATFHHQLMRARGAIAAINACYHRRMRGFAAGGAILGFITDKIAGSSSPPACRDEIKKDG